MGEGWVRGIAKVLAQAAHERFGPICQEEGLYRSIDQLTREETLQWKATFWVAPPEAVGLFRRIRPDWMILPAGEHSIGFLQPNAGTLVLPSDFGAETLELFDKWTASSQLDFKLWIDWKAVCYCPLTGLEHQGIITTRMP